MKNSRRQSLLRRSALIVLFCAAFTPVLAVSYVSNAAGDWATTTIWTPNGTPGSADSVTINHAVTMNTAQSILHIAIGAAGTFTPGAGLTLNVYGDWWNSGTYTTGTAIVNLCGSATQYIGGGNPTTFYKVTVNTNTLTTTVTQLADVTVSQAAANALVINIGTWSTNGYNLTVNNTSASISGNGALYTNAASGKLNINTGGTVNINLLDQTGTVTGLSAVSISGAATVVNIANTHNVGAYYSGAYLFHVCNISGGTVNYTATGATVNLSISAPTYTSGYGWYATGGTITFNGSITATYPYASATGTSVIIFAGGANSTWTLLSFGGGPIGWMYNFNDIRIQKTSGYGLTMTASASGMVNTSFPCTYLTVNAGNTLNLTYSGYRGAVGWNLVNVVNNGAIVQTSNGGTSTTGDIVGNATWTGTGSFTQGAAVPLPGLTSTGNVAAGAVTTTGTVTVSGATGLTCGPLTQTSGTITVANGSINTTSAGLTQNGGTLNVPNGGIDCGSGAMASAGTVTAGGNVSCGTFTQGAGAGTATVNGTTGLTCTGLTQNGGTLNVPNGGINCGSGAMASASTITAGGGVTCGAYTQSAGALTVGGDLTCASFTMFPLGGVTVRGNVNCAGAYSGSQGITFAGTGARTFTAASILTGSLTINKTGGGSMAPSRDLIVKSALTVTAGTFILGAHTLMLGDIGAPASMAVNSGGTFSIVGSAFASGRVTSTMTAYPYSFTARSGSMIHALYAQFDGMDAGGINIAGLVDLTNNFSNCTFDHGTVAGPMLKVENPENLNMTNVSFTGSAGYNIEKLANSGHISVTAGGGNRWGPAFENDPNIKIDWLGADIGPTAILAPTGSYDTSAVITPQVKVKNFSTMAVTNAKIVFRIDSTAGNTVYADTLTKDIAPSAESTWSFDAWPAINVARTYASFCSTYVSGDTKPSNDVIRGSFTISAAPPPPPGWNAKKFMPDAPGGKQMKDGAWLAYDGSTEFIYGAKGNKVGDFYAYDPAGDSWKALSLMPPGTEAKPPYKGAAGCASGNGVVYATKGNNTQGFFSYRAETDSWKQLANVPLGLSNKKVKGGTDLQYVVRGDTGFVYLLKGYKNEFYRYNTAKDTWQSLPDAPGTLNVKWNAGSWLAYDGTGKLYGHQAKYHGHYAFDVATGTWGPALKGMPFISRTGKSKKSKDGGCAALADDFIYALKGGNTQEFWQYFVSGDSWHELDTIPVMAPGSTKKKKVKAGGDITNADGVLYATKGNKSNEMWSWDLTPAFLAPRADRSGVMVQSRLAIADCRLSITPNPLNTGFATLRYNLSAAGPVSIGIFDVTGRQVLLKSIVAGRSGATSLDLRSLSAGVYLVKLTSKDLSSSQKLVVQR